MQVEIYDERELDASLTVEPTEEQLELIHELGLERQLAESGAPLIYPKVSLEQSIVIRVLFSQHSRLEAYDAGRIPLRILKEIRSYKAEYPEHQLVIYHEPDLTVQDPILLAYTENHGPYYFERLLQKPILVARWGSALESWATLYEQATKKLATIRLRQFLKLRADLDSVISAIKDGAGWSNMDVPSLNGVDNDLPF